VPTLLHRPDAKEVSFHFSGHPSSPPRRNLRLREAYGSPTSFGVAGGKGATIGRFRTYRSRRVACCPYPVIDGWLIEKWINFSTAHVSLESDQFRPSDIRDIFRNINNCNQIRQCLETRQTPKPIASFDNRCGTPRLSTDVPTAVVENFHNGRAAHRAEFFGIVAPIIDDSRRSGTGRTWRMERWLDSTVLAFEPNVGHMENPWFRIQPAYPWLYPPQR
jgi:hypothetical protein